MDEVLVPHVSIIIATYNRAASVMRVLEALAQQSVDEGTFEVILVSDGCSDDTVARARGLETPFPLTVLDQENSGPAQARNAGAGAARAELLVFLDDDIVPHPGFVTGHLSSHRDTACRPLVVIGYLPTRLDTQRGIYASALRGWWEAMFDRIAKPGHRFAYSDLLSGNFSLSAAFFRQVGGFQSELRCHEDYELGYRLIEAGACFALSREAMGVHEERTDFARSLRRQFDEGIADVWLARHHPSLIPELRLGRFGGSRLTRLAMGLAFSARWLAAVLTGGTFLLLVIADRLRFRRIWRRLADLLLMHHYWRGVVTAVGTRASFLKLIEARDNPLPSTTTLFDIDLQNGLAEAEKILNEARPQGVALKWGRAFVGTVPASRSRERLHGGHLRALLQHQFADEFLRAVGLQVLEDRDGWSNPLNPGPASPSTGASAPIGLRAPAQ